MGKRFNKVRSDWASGEKDQGEFSHVWQLHPLSLAEPFCSSAHDAKMLLNLPLEEAADWIDEHLPPPPNSDSLTGSDIPLPPSPRSTPILATAPLFSPPRVSIPLPKKTQHQIEEPKRLDETPKSRDQLALIPSTPVKDEQGTTALPSPPSTAELAATATFSSKLPSFTPPPESVETPASPVHHHTISGSLSKGGHSTIAPRQRRVSSKSRSPRIPLPETSETPLDRRTARSRSPHLSTSLQSRRRPVFRSRSPPIPPHPNHRSRRRFRSPSSHKSHPRVQSRSPSPRRIRGRSPSPYGLRHRLPSPRSTTQPSPPRFERERLPSPLYEIGQPLRWDPTVGLVAVQRKGDNSRW